MKINQLKISVLIRTHNEARWIKQCITKLYEQTVKPDEIVVIDNKSEDGTLDICKKFKKVKIFKYNKKYLPGKMLNYGIRKSKNSYVAILSAHCIPYNKFFLEKLVEPFFKEKNIFASYSRQIPLESSDPITIRDLMITYGPESRIQKTDPQFNNASSLISKDIWKNNNFDEKTTNLEDRIWASKILKNKKYIYYASKSIVYHYHGSHHNNTETRLTNTNKVIKENKKNFNQLSGRLNYSLKSILPIFILRDCSKKKMKEHIKNFAKLKLNRLIFLTNEKYKISNNNVKFIKRKREEFKNQNIYLDEVLKIYMKEIISFLDNEEYILLCTDIYDNYSIKNFKKFINEINLNFPQVLFFAKETKEPIFIEEEKSIKKINYFLKKDRSMNNPVFIADRSKGIIIHLSNFYKNSIFDGKISLCT